MFVNINDSHVIFNENQKSSIRECYLNAYPTNDVDAVCIQFKGDNFKNLLNASKVDEHTIEELLKRKELSEIDSVIRDLTSSSKFLPYTDDFQGWKGESMFTDVLATMENVAELRNYKDFELENWKDIYLVTLLSNSECEDCEIKEFFDFFPNFYEEKVIQSLNEHNEKKLKLKDTMWGNRQKFIFENNKIVVSPELGFIIQGEAYENLLKNTKEYIEEYSPYVLDRDLDKLIETEEDRKYILTFLKDKKHHNFKTETDADLEEYFKFILKFSKAFPLYYD